jgi:hypothetical protein
MSISPVQSANATPVKHNNFKKAAVALGTVAAGATIIGIGAKKGKFAVSEDSGAISKALNPKLQKLGDFINQKADAAKTKVSEKIVNSKAYNKASETVNNVKTKVQEFSLKDLFAKKAETVAENAEVVAEQAQAAAEKVETVVTDIA